MKKMKNQMFRHNRGLARCKRALLAVLLIYSYVIYEVIFANNHVLVVPEPGGGPSLLPPHPRPRPLSTRDHNWKFMETEGKKNASVTLRWLRNHTFAAAAGIHPGHHGKHRRKQKNNNNSFVAAVTRVPPGDNVRRSEDPNEATASSCLLFMDDNHHMTEWIAYHYFALPLRYLVIAVDSASKTQPKIHDYWRKKMVITIWEDKDFNRGGINLTRQENHGRDQHIALHRSRQRMFYQACASYLKDLNRTYTTFHDVDEFLTINSDFFAGRPAWNGSQSVDYSDAAYMSRPGHVMRMLKEFNRQPATSSQVHRELSRVCLHVPRVLYTAVETDKMKRQRNIPTWIDSDQFDTLRYRYRHSIRGVSNGAGKTLIDVSRLTSSDFTSGSSVHSPFKSVCPKDNMYREYGSLPLGIHHYLGSWESYSFRDDARKGTSIRGRKAWLEKSAQTEGGSDDEITAWVWGFEKTMGTSLAQELLKGAGLDIENFTRVDYAGW